MMRSRVRRGFAAVAAVALAAAVATTTGPAGAQTTRQRLDSTRQRITQLKSRAAQIAKAYGEAERDLNRTSRQITETNAAISDARRDIDQLQSDLRERVRRMYRMGGLGFFEFVLSAASFRDFSLRVMTLQRDATRDEDLILKLRKKRAELAVQQGVLRDQKAAQSRQVASYRAQARRLTISQQEQARIARQLEGLVRSEELARLFRIGGSLSRGRGIAFPLDACPAAGPRSFSDSWGAPRSGGRRHKGTDIMSPYGSPAAAVVSGRITRTGSGGLGGLSIYLYGDDGNEYYYAHMSRNAVGAGARVSAGQIISYVGDSGNARGGAPHIHFEIHPGGGGAVNPYPSLIRVC